MELSCTHGSRVGTRTELSYTHGSPGTCMEVSCTHGRVPMDVHGIELYSWVPRDLYGAEPYSRLGPQGVRSWDVLIGPHGHAWSWAVLMGPKRVV